MKAVEKDFDENDLIREEEINAVRGDRPMPRKELLDYWRSTLKSWLDEYCDKDEPKAFTMPFNAVAPVNYCEIRFDTSTEKVGGYGFFAVLGCKEKDNEKRWLCCPISNFKTPATMWEFKIPLASGRLVIAESWNIFSASDKDIFEKTRIPKSANRAEWHLRIDSVGIILHAFNRQMEGKFQDLPMTSVGPRIFRTNDPRIEYQKNEHEKFKLLSQIGALRDNDELQKKLNAISAKDWLLNNENKENQNNDER